MRILGVLDGNDVEDFDLRKWVESAEFVIAADGAANRLSLIGSTPDLIVGDLDSVWPDVPGQRFHVVDQDHTDCEKLLEQVARQGADSLTLIGVEGDRLDHVLATLSACAASNLNVRLVLRRQIGHLVRGALTIGCRPDSLVSLMPITPCSGVTFSGVAWPLAGADLEPGKLVSVSNRAVEEKIGVTIASGVALLLTERTPDQESDWHA